MDFLNKARKKAEKAVNDIAALAANPDKNRYQYHNQGPYQSQAQQLGYAGGPPWEQHQQGVQQPSHYGSFSSQPPYQGGQSVFQAGPNQQHVYQPPYQGQNVPPSVQYQQYPNQRYSVSSPPPPQPYRNLAASPVQYQQTPNHRFSVSSQTQSHQNQAASTVQYAQNPNQHYNISPPPQQLNHGQPQSYFPPQQSQNPQQEAFTPALSPPAQPQSPPSHVISSPATTHPAQGYQSFPPTPSQYSEVSPGASSNPNQPPPPLNPQNHPQNYINPQTVSQAPQSTASYHHLSGSQISPDNVQASPLQTNQHLPHRQSVSQAHNPLQQHQTFSLASPHPTSPAQLTPQITSPISPQPPQTFQAGPSPPPQNFSTPPPPPPQQQQSFSPSQVHPERFTTPIPPPQNAFPVARPIEEHSSISQQPIQNFQAVPLSLPPPEQQPQSIYTASQQQIPALPAQASGPSHSTPPPQQFIPNQGDQQVASSLSQAHVSTVVVPQRTENPETSPSPPPAFPPGPPVSWQDNDAPPPVQMAQPMASQSTSTNHQIPPPSSVSPSQSMPYQPPNLANSPSPSIILSQDSQYTAPVLPPHSPPTPRMASPPAPQTLPPSPPQANPPHSRPSPELHHHNIVPAPQSQTPSPRAYQRKPVSQSQLPAVAQHDMPTGMTKASQTANQVLPSQADGETSRQSSTGIESQMSSLSLPDKSPSNPTVGGEPSSNQALRDTEDNRDLYPQPLQPRNKTPKPPIHELGSAVFAAELPGCEAFSSQNQSPTATFAVELPGSETFPTKNSDDRSQAAPEPESEPKPVSEPASALAPAPAPEPTPLPPDTSISIQNQECIGDQGAFTKYSRFFVLKGAGSFAVCEPCYRFRVTPNANIVAHFTPYAGVETQIVCNLSFPGVQALFSSQCIPQNTVQPLINFSTNFPNILPCPGSSTSPGPMHVIKGDMTPRFAICMSCYELHIRHTVFEEHFRTQTTAGGEGNEWTCALSLPYYKRLLQNEFKKPNLDWVSFVEEAQGRLLMPDCPGPGKPVQPMGDIYVVFTAAGGKTGNICLACYCDYVAFTSLANAFVAAHLGEDQIGKITCDLAGVYTKTAIGVAIKRADDQIWRTAVGLEGRLSPCAGARGVDEADLEKEMAARGNLDQWYSFAEYPNVECCPRCYYLYVSLFGAAHLLSPITRPLVAGVIRTCSWAESAAPADASVKDHNNFENTTTYRGRMLRNCLSFAYHTGDCADLLSVAQIFNLQPPPCAGNLRGFKKISGRKFFGRIAEERENPNETTIVLCQECHWSIIDETPLAPLMSRDLTEMAYEAADPEKGFSCQPYSKRAKAELRQAAEAGNLAQFARYWNQREELRKKREAWQPILAQQDERQRAYNSGLSRDVQLKVNAQGNALTRIGGAMIHEAAMGETGVRYGNSVVGMNYLTAGRAEAEMAMHVANNMQVGHGGDVIAESKRLLQLFNVDNEAFLAVE